MVLANELSIIGCGLSTWLNLPKMYLTDLGGDDMNAIDLLQDVFEAYDYVPATEAEIWEQLCSELDRRLGAEMRRGR